MGGGISAIGDFEQGQAEANMADYEAAVANNNATVAGEQGTYALQAGVVKSEQTSLASRGAAGRIVANQAANNIDVNSGSAVQVQTSQRQAALADVQQIQHNARLTNYGYRAQAANLQSQATLDRFQGDQAMEGAAFKALGDLMGGSSSGGSMPFSWGGADASGGAAGGAGAGGDAAAAGGTDAAAGASSEAGASDAAAAVAAIF